jgi:hypothetical protein
MAKRDEEIVRIRKYCEALGVKLVMRNKSSKMAAAEWRLDGSQITVWITQPENKTETVLSLLHELGHQLWHVHHKNREEDIKIIEVYNRIVLSSKITESTEADRRVVLNVERAGAEYWDVIVKDLDIKIPAWRIEAQKRFDVWQYEFYYENCHFPNRADRRLKIRELKEELKN